MKRLQGLMLVIFVLVAAPALMAQRVLKATLQGDAEVPAVATGAYGTFVGLLSADGLSIDYTLTVNNMGTEFTASHFHIGGPLVAGPVVVPLYSAKDEGKWKGKKVGTVTAADFKSSTAFSDIGVNSFSDVVDNILRGNAYVNAHSTKFPGGEVRGKVTVVDNK